MLDRVKLRKQLEEMAEEEYRKFTSSLLPGVSNILGVRLPILRKLAGRIAKSEDLREWLPWMELMCACPDSYFEEKMLWGMTIGCAGQLPGISTEEWWEQVRRFVPYIDSWSVCDSFCSGLKRISNCKEEGKIVLSPYLQSEKEYECRFAAVILLNYYVTESDLSWTLNQLDRITHPGYYSKMAVAWALSICYVKFPVQTHSYLRGCSLDQDTFHMTVRKIIESKRVGPEVKKEVRELENSRI